MRKTGLSKWLLALMLLLLLVLAACSDGGDSEEAEGSSNSETEEGTEEAEDSEGTASEGGTYSIEDFSPATTGEGEAIEGGNLNFGLVSDSVFAGTLNWNFYEDEFDKEIIQWFDEPMLYTDKNHAYTQEGPAQFEVSDDNKTFTFTIRDSVNWHDGEPVKAEDWAYAFEVIGSPDYTGIRYDSSFMNIEGMEAYHNGDADTISGIEVVDEKTLEITFIEANPSLVAGGIWPYAMPKHIFEDISIAEMAESDAVRKNPIGMGAFKVDSIVPGESVSMTANEDYWQGEPNIDSLNVQVVSPQTVVQALETGEIDFVHSFPTDQFADVEESLTNVEFLGQIDMAYTYIGFKLGKWNADEGQVEMDPEAKMADVELRRAMWHAVDNDAVGEQFYNGLRWAGTTLIPPSHPDFHNETVEAPTYDPEQAKQLLEDAGYVDTNDDGFREDPDGEELVINFASMAGGDIAEPLANYYIQAWEQVGLKVELVDGRLLEFNSFYDRVEADDPAIDIYQGAWGVASDVDPSGLYGREAQFNYSRYASEENDELLAEGASEASLDTEHRQEVYSEWQELMVEEIPVFPTLYRSELVATNNRIQNYSIAYEWWAPHEIAVTQEEPETVQ
ncbi:oligopeptide ABC transporter substrate-binding protein [Virgibacillus ainsalahensis]